MSISGSPYPPAPRLVAQFPNKRGWPQVHRGSTSTRALWFTLLLIVGQAGPSAAQAVVGRVVDIDSQQGVDGAQISLVDSVGEIVGGNIADSAGYFSIPVSERGSYRLRVEHIAYEALTSERLRLTMAEVVSVLLRVSETRIPVEPLVVTARRSTGNVYLRDFYRRMEKFGAIGKGIFLTRTDLQKLEGLTTLEAFSREPVRFLRPNPFIPCLIRTYWNGLLVEEVTDEQWRGRMQGGSTKPGGRALWEVPASAAEGMEIYDDMHEMPPEFYDYNVCGVILVWSRPIRPGEGGRGSWLTRGVIAAGAFVVLLLISGR